MKIRLADAAAHQKVADLLAASHQVTHLQENVFFDGAAQQLSSARMVLRLRFYNGDERCVVTLKGKAVIIDGISRGSEVSVPPPLSLSLLPSSFSSSPLSGLSSPSYPPLRMVALIEIPNPLTNGFQIIGMQDAKPPSFEVGPAG